MIRFVYDLLRGSPSAVETFRKNMTFGALFFLRGVAYWLLAVLCLVPSAFIIPLLFAPGLLVLGITAWIYVYPHVFLLVWCLFVGLNEGWEHVYERWSIGAI